VGINEIWWPGSFGPESCASSIEYFEILEERCRRLGNVVIAVEEVEVVCVSPYIISIAGDRM
jgi:hypothetical protein